ncbi:hypothetical protein EJB05_09054, partial [Eragrostis curvula]
TSPHRTKPFPSLPPPLSTSSITVKINWLRILAVGRIASAFKKTASRSTTKAVQGTHVFEVVGYSLKRGIGVDKYVQLRTFTVGGYDWAIRFYPDGLKSSEEYVAVHLELISNNAEVRARYELRLVGKAGRISDFMWCNHKPRWFRSQDTTRFSNTSRFCLRSELEQEGIHNDCLTIECDLTVVKESQLSDIRVKSEINVPPCDISQNLGRLMEEKDGSDVTFCVGKETFAAHKLVLAARSLVFRAEFYGQMKETRMGYVTIKDMQPAVFEALLRFIYTGSLLAMDHLDRDEYHNMICHLLAAADRYAVDRLKLMCESILSKDLHVDNVATTFALADQHNCNKLKEACIDFIISSNQMKDVVASLDYRKFERTLHDLIVDALEKTRKQRRVQRSLLQSRRLPRSFPSAAAVVDRFLRRPLYRPRAGRSMSAESKKTASRCTTETETGGHTFEIVGYSFKKGMGVGRSIRSATFAVGGYDWAIRFYPDGSTEASKDYATAFLELVSKNAEVRARYNIRFVSQPSVQMVPVPMGGPPLHQMQMMRNQMVGTIGRVPVGPRLFKSSDTTRFGSQNSAHMLRSRLEQGMMFGVGYIRDDRLSIECDVTVIRDSHLSGNDVESEIEVPPYDIMEHFGKLLIQKEGADVTFSVAGDTFEAHKIVLAARSPVFKAQFYGLLRESGTHCVTVEDMQPAVFRVLLHFIYNDSLPDMSDLEGNDYGEMMRHLLVAADRYAMERLKVICESIILKNLDVDNVADTLALADQHHCDRLKAACIEFMASSKNVDAVMATQGIALFSPEVMWIPSGFARWLSSWMENILLFVVPFL